MASSGCAASSARKVRSAVGKSPRCMAAMALRSAMPGSINCPNRTAAHSHAIFETLLKTRLSGQAVLAECQALLHLGDEVRFRRISILQLDVTGKGILLL